MAKQEKLKQIANKLLHQIAREQNFAYYDLKAEFISRQGDNYTSALLKATLTEDDKLIHLFVKIANICEPMRLHSINPFKVEYLAYSKVLKAYERLQNAFSIPQEHRLTFLKLYGYRDVEYEETIVFEDLNVRGYQCFDRLKVYDCDTVKLIITQMAKMHALSFAYSEHYSTEFREVDKSTKRDWRSIIDHFRSQFIETISDSIKFTNDENKDKLRRYYDGLRLEEGAVFFKPLRRPVLVHCDYRYSNLMYKQQEDGTIDIRVIDFQGIQCSSPVVDLLQFILGNTDEEFRGKFYEELLNHYYEQLKAAMERLNLDVDAVYSRDDFEYEVKEKLPLSVTVALIILPVVTAERKPDTEVTAHSFFNAKNAGQLHKDRLNGVVNDFVKWGILK